MVDEETAAPLPLGSDGQPFCICEHERQKHFGDRRGCHGFECGCKKYEPRPVTGQPELQHCPHCADAVVNLDEHLKTCTARQEDPLIEARRLLAEDQQQRAEACAAEIETALAKHGMRLQISQPQISIVPA